MSVSLHQRGGSSAATPFDVNLHLFLCNVIEMKSCPELICCTLRVAFGENPRFLYIR